MPKFRDAAEQYIQVNAPTWRGRKTVGNTRAQLDTYAYPVFGDTPVDRSPAPTCWPRSCPSGQPSQAPAGS